MTESLALNTSFFLPGTRNLELGKVFAFPGRKKDVFMARDSVTCPKCKKDVSDKRFAVKEHELYFRLAAATITIRLRHLQAPLLSGITVMGDGRHESFSKLCKARPKLVRSFRKCD